MFSAEGDPLPTQANDPRNNTNGTNIKSLFCVISRMVLCNELSDPYPELLLFASPASLKGNARDWINSTSLSMAILALV